MESAIVGQLSQSKFANDLYESEPFEIPYFNNKRLKISYFGTADPKYFDSAEKVLKNFLDLTSDTRINDSLRVFAYYFQTLSYGYTKSLDIWNPSDIWNFVTPTEIMIEFDDDYEFYVCASCECDWEIEHGLQLIFKNGTTLTRASGHDGHVTD